MTLAGATPSDAGEQGGGLFGCWVTEQKQIPPEFAQPRYAEAPSAPDAPPPPPPVPPFPPPPLAPPSPPPSGSLPCSDEHAKATAATRRLLGIRRTGSTAPS